VLLMDDGMGRNAALMVDAMGKPARLDERTLTALPAVFRGQERVRFEALAVVDGRVVVVIAPRGLLVDVRPRQVAV